MASRLLKKIMKASHRPSRPPAAPPPLDTAALAQRIGKRLAGGETFEVAASKALRKVQPVVGHPGDDTVPPRASLKPIEIDPSPAYAKMWKAAVDLSGENGETPETNFARIYSDPRNREIVAAEKRDHFTRTYRAALPLPGACPGWEPASAHNADDRLPPYSVAADADAVDDVSKKIVKLLKRSPGLTFEAAATRILRGKAA